MNPLPEAAYRMNAAPPSRPRIVMSDVDDTLTWEGQLPVAALAAMHRLAAAGIELIPVTGACAGWCDQMARTWPVSAVIGENGAFVIERQGRRLRYHDSAEAATRARHRARLHQLAAELIARMPGFALAGDDSYRRYDVAVDHHQDVAPVAPCDIAAALAYLRAAGVNAAASSIHINTWIGPFSKRQAACQWLQAHYGMDAATQLQAVAFIGDSSNDEAMFAHFPRSVGVANIRPHLPNLSRAPALITQQPGGFGFAEWVDALLG